MNDLAALQRLKAAYVRCVDTKRWAELRTLLVDDFTFTRRAGPHPPPPGSVLAGSVLVGAEAFVQSLRIRFATAVTVHRAYLPELDLAPPTEDGSVTAQGIWAMSDWIDGPASGPSFRGSGHYHETYRLGADGRWRFVTMELSRLRIDVVAPTPPGQLEATRDRWSHGWPTTG